MKTASLRLARYGTTMLALLQASSAHASSRPRAWYCVQNKSDDPVLVSVDGQYLFTVSPGTTSRAYSVSPAGSHRVRLDGKQKHTGRPLIVDSPRGITGADKQHPTVIHFNG